MSRQLSLLILSLLLILPPAAAAQLSSLPRPDENRASDEKPAAAIEKKAFDLLEASAEQVPNLHSPANRLHAECAIADLLWSRDEKRARALFKTASDDLINLIANADSGDQDAYQQLNFLGQLRSELITRLAVHDPEAAVALLRATRIGASNDPRTKWYADMETNLELQLAGMIAKQNPARSLELAEAALARGLSYSLMNFLMQLQTKDPKAAQTFYKELVDKIKQEDLERNPEVSNVAWNLLWFQPPQANEDLYRELIGTLINSALAITPMDQGSINLAQNIYGQLPSLMPQVEKYAPARVGSLRQWSQNVERSFDPSTRMYQELNRVAQNGTVDDVLALAPRYPAELQVQIYQQAAWKALSTGDANRARQIIMDSISDPALRRQMLAQIDNQLLETAIGEEKIPEVRQLLTHLKSVEQRVQYLLRLAGMRTRKGDKKGALELLNEARAAADAMPTGSAQLSSKLQLAQSYAELDPEQSFAIVQPLVLKSNELIAAAAVLDGFDTHYFKDGEWITPGANMLGNVVNGLGQLLAVLARVDFDRAHALADQIERSELRLLADLEIARAGLGSRIMRLPPATAPLVIID